MSRIPSRLQEPFLRVFAANFTATKARIMRRLAAAPVSQADAIIEDELKGLYHGLLVILDGGSSLAEEGLVRLVDEDGVAFDHFLHEICFRFWPATDQGAERQGGMP